MNKTFITSFFLLLVISCKTDKDQATTETSSSFEIETEEWPRKTIPNSKTKEILKDWEAFNALETSFDAIYNIGNTEDLNLVLEDLIEKQKALSESEYPEPYDKPQIKSRQKALYTYILKIKGDLVYRVDTKESVVQMIEAHNAMLYQMNLISSNTLDLKTLLEEEQ